MTKTLLTKKIEKIITTIKEINKYEKEKKKRENLNIVILLISLGKHIQYYNYTKRGLSRENRKGNTKLIYLIN
jgi:hypothetical protein